MGPRRLRRAVPVVAAAIALASAAAPVAAARPAVITSTVVSHATTKVHALTTPGMQKIQAISVPAGTWSIFAKATAVDPGSTDFFRCELVATKPLSVLDGATSQLNSFVHNDVITNVALFTTATTATIRQECGHDGAAGDSGSIDPAASVVAFATPAARVRLARTTAQTSLGSNAYVGVGNLSLTKGTWVVAAKVSPVALTVPNARISCLDSVGGFERDFTSSDQHGVTTAFQVGYVGVAGPSTLNLLCKSDVVGPYLDPDVVFWAWKSTDLTPANSTSSDACPLTATGTTANDALVLHQIDCNVASGSYPSQIIGVHLTAGTWVAIGAFDELSSIDGNQARCQILQTKRGKQLDTSSATLEDTPDGNFMTTVANLTALSVAAQLDVEARCGQDLATTDPSRAVDSGWAFIKP